MANKRKKIGIALGGGGARGFAHIGVLKVLQKEGIKIDYIAGVSMGALVGAYFSLGLNLEKIEEECLTFNKRKAFKLFIDFANPMKSILKGEKIEKYINSLVKNADFKDLEIPMQILATDLVSGEQVLLKHGHLASAIKASICVPGIFPPVKIDNRYLIDGGVVNPTPIDVVKKMGADLVIGVDLVMKRKIPLENPGMVTTILQSYETIRTLAVKYSLSKMNGSSIMIKPDVRGAVESFKFYDIEKFIRAGERATIKKLPEIKKRLAKID